MRNNGFIWLAITTFALSNSFRTRPNISPVKSETVTVPATPVRLRSEPISDNTTLSNRILIWYRPTRFFYIPDPGRLVPHRPKNEIVDHHRYAPRMLDIARMVGHG